jgi:hypothetical protein
MRKNWVTRDIRLGRLIIKSVLLLIDTGTRESAACYQVAQHYGGDPDVLLRLYAKIKARQQRQKTYKLQPVARRAAKCIYCGQPGRFIPVVDWRGEVVGAHAICERMEQMISGGL